MSILGSKKIQEEVESGEIVIDPWDPRMLNSVSVDLTLGDEMMIYTTIRGEPNPIELDSRLENPVFRTRARDDGWMLIRPGYLYLLHTRERVSTKKYVPIIDGKSSIGRLGICVHATAGFGDPGFDGQYTLEVTSVYPTALYAGMRICQMRFETIEGEARLYDGNYKGETSRGPVPSRSWKQFTEAELDEGMLHKAAK